MNRLKNEESPYLLQHSDNPVNWYPWKDEAFKTAKEKDKPLFISIGYSTCHWCHVMNDECFKDKEVADLLNDAFIPIKVDREERRDVDNIYMLASHIINNSGGWPLTIFATPDKKPFFAATYIAKHTKGNRPGLMELIPHIKFLWETKKETICKAAEQIFNVLESIDNVSQRDGKDLNDDFADYCYESLYNIFDLRYGGFGKKPKFPMPHNIKFFITYGIKKNNEKPVGLALKTLKSIRLGGIYDQIRGGVHRYSTDEKWLIPHFEKTLYDQALISEAYIDAYNATKEKFYRDCFEDILNYAVSELRSTSGGFFSGEDAKHDFYTWEYEELIKNFGNEIKETVNIEPQGNFFDEKTGKRTGKNVLSIKSSEKLKDFEKIREKFKELIKTREKPAKDRKILLDWNSLMVISLFKAFGATQNRKFLNFANETLEFLLHNMKKDSKFYHMIMDNNLLISGFIDDYLFLTEALLASHEFGYNEEHLSLAESTINIAIENFWDIDKGAFFFTDESAENVVIRKKEFLDSAMPSANSKALGIFKKLAIYTKDEKYLAFANDLTRVYSHFVEKSPVAFTEFFCGFLGD